MVTKAHDVLIDRKDKLSTKQAENDLMHRQIADMEKRILASVDSLEVGKEALTFLEELANSRRGHMKGKIESVITEAVQLIYGPTYKVELSYSVKNNRSCLEIEMVRPVQAGEIRRDMNGFGGGMADTISVPLRLMVLMGSKETDKVCILDECWKHIDTTRVELVGKFLRMLADKLGVQLLFCSHHDIMTDFSDKTYRVDLDAVEGKSSIDVF
jgi:chromosome segregation ATPase